nr:LuxR C-terminal-related transcriptional regulator [Streptacidiphilus melanogenes]
MGTSAAAALSDGADAPAVPGARPWGRARCSTASGWTAPLPARARGRRDLLAGPDPGRRGRVPVVDRAAPAPGGAPGGAGRCAAARRGRRRTPGRRGGRRGPRGRGDRRPRRGAGPAGLATREIDVLRLLARGCSSKEIAVRLVVSPKSARNHIEHIYAKIGTSSRASACLFALQNGLL